MTIKRWFCAALFGAAVPFALIGGMSAVHASDIRIVQRGTAETLNVPMNRAVVVESETPFAELSIANATIADISSLSDRTIYVLGKAPGTTTLTILDGAGQLITNVNIRVAPDLAEFKERLRQILPGEKIEVRSANDGIVLSGIVSSSQRLQRALDLAERYAEGRVSNLMSVGGVQQVMLKVRFAEMNRTVSKTLSSSLAIDGGIFGGDVGVNAGSGTTVGSGGVTNSLSGSVPAANENTGALLLGFSAGSAQIGLLIEALENKGMVRTLAEPNLVALSGQEAKFLAGGEYPVPVAQDGGTIAIEFKPFGIGLNFIPRVVDQKLINLELEAEVSEIDPTNGFSINGFEVDAFTVRRSSTTVEIRDGESFAIAGLLQDNFRDSSAQLPWIGDVPVLGSLFRSASYQRSQSELVIIITAHLVTPTRGDVLALPTDRVTPPSERDLFLNGRVASRTKAPTKGPAAEVAKQDFSGSYGYVLD
ncbi:MAG: type II and III secretion system protein family protein [Rhodobacteraceae bacterium]|nr:type II and III secretion system protein family protein [Paracoccaceae bacterium]